MSNRITTLVLDELLPADRSSDRLEATIYNGVARIAVGAALLVLLALTIVDLHPGVILACLLLVGLGGFEVAAVAAVADVSLRFSRARGLYVEVDAP